MGAAVEIIIGAQQTVDDYIIRNSALNALEFSWVSARKAAFLKLQDAVMLGAGVVLGSYKEEKFNSLTMNATILRVTVKIDADWRVLLRMRRRGVGVYRVKFNEDKE